MLDRSYKNSLENNFVHSFIKGLKFEIEQRVARNIDLTTTVSKALRIEKELRDISEISGIRGPLINACQFGKNPGLTADNYRILTKPNLGNEILISQICKKRNHSADKCRLREQTSQKPVKLV